MPLLEPTRKRSQSFGSLVADFFVSPIMTDSIRRARLKEVDAARWDIGRDGQFPDTPSDKTTTLDHFKDALFKTYSFDGADPSDYTYITADGDKSPISAKTLTPRMFITSILGLPNRPNSFAADGTPILSFKQAVKDWFGGWTALYSEPNATKRSEIYRLPVDDFEKSGPKYNVRPSSEAIDSKILGELAQDSTSNPSATPKKQWNINVKTVMQIPALLFKVLVIAPIKIITWPFKVLLNVAKFFTEALPLFLTNISAEGIGKLSAEVRDKWLDRKRLLNDYETDVADPDAKNITKVPNVLGPIAWRVLAIGLLGIVHYTTKVIALVGRAITSPEMSARMAFTYGRGLIIKTGTLGEQEWTKLSDVLGFILGSVGALVSFAVSATIWAIMLPLAIGSLLSFIPQALPLLNWFANLPVVATSLTTVGSAFGTVASLVSTTVGSVFAPAITAIATLLPGLVVSAQAIAVGATFGLIAAPIASMLSRVADVLSNLWASWNPPRKDFIFALNQSVMDLKSEPGYRRLEDGHYSTEVKTLVEEGTKVDKLARKSANSIDSVSTGVELVDLKKDSNTGNTPASSQRVGTTPRLGSTDDE